MEQFRSVMEDTGELEWRRREQHLRWMWSYVEERLVTMARESGVNDDNIAKLEMKVKCARAKMEKLLLNLDRPVVFFVVL